MYGEIYSCNHPVYSECTLFKIDNLGLAVIQQYYDEPTKHTWWSSVEYWIANDIYVNPNFLDYFNKYAKEVDGNNIYPTVSVRQIMWALKMKPLPRQKWETSFDHVPI